MKIQAGAIVGLLVAIGVSIVPASGASALSMKECSTKFKAAKADGTLAGQSFADFRAANCGTDVAAADGSPSMGAVTLAAATPAPAPTPAANPSAAPASPPVFPTAVASKYAGETPGNGRMHTCLDQYNANKANNANGGLKWIQNGGGYYSQCSKKLKG